MGSAHCYSIFLQYITTVYSHSISLQDIFTVYVQYILTVHFHSMFSRDTFRKQIVVLNISPGKFSGSPLDLAPSSLLSFSSLSSLVLLIKTFFLQKMILKFICFPLSQSLPNLLEVYLFLAQACTAGEGEGLRNMWFQTCDWKHFKHVIENSWKMWLKTLDMSLKTFKTCYYNHSKHVIENTSNMCYRYLSWNASNGNMDVVNKIYVTEI